MKCEDCKHCDLCYEWDGEDEVQYQFCRKHGKELEMDADGCEDFKVYAGDWNDMQEVRCESCKWHDSFTWVCCNGDSEYRADFTENNFMCGEWEIDDRREISGTARRE